VIVQRGKKRGAQVDIHRLFIENKRKHSYPP
jgi:hypothetical protein